MSHPLNNQQVRLIHQKSIQSELGQELYTGGTHLIDKYHPEDIFKTLPILLFFIQCETFLFIDIPS